MTSTSLTPANNSLPTAPCDAAPHCANCDAILHGQFCAQCGQKRRTQRTDFAVLWHDAADKLMDLESGFSLTLRLLLRDPKRLMLDYFNGKQRCYTHPLTLLIALATLSFISTALFGDVFWQQLKSVMSTNNARHFTPEQLDRYIAAFVTLNSLIPYWVLAFTLPTAALTRLLFGNRFNIAEYWLMIVYAVALGIGFDAIISAVLFLSHAPFLLMINSFNAAIAFAFLTVLTRSLGGGIVTFIKLLIPLISLSVLMTWFLGLCAMWMATHGG